MKESTEEAEGKHVIPSGLSRSQFWPADISPPAPVRIFFKVLKRRGVLMFDVTQQEWEERKKEFPKLLSLCAKEKAILPSHCFIFLLREES